MTEEHFETFSTTADVGIRFRGRGFQNFFNCAIKGLNLLCFGDILPVSTEPVEGVLFRYRGDSCENILVNLLAEVVFLLQNNERMTTTIIVNEADETYLDAELLTVPRITDPVLEIKSVTYHNLKITDHAGLKSTAIVFDI